RPQPRLRFAFHPYRTSAHHNQGHSLLMINRSSLTLIKRRAVSRQSVGPTKRIECGSSHELGIRPPSTFSISPRCQGRFVSYMTFHLSFQSKEDQPAFNRRASIHRVSPVFLSFGRNAESSCGIASTQDVTPGTTASHQAIVVCRHQTASRPGREERVYNEL